MAGKTGTAQTGSEELNLPTRGAFACYAPADKPRIALVVLLDNAGSASAARIVGNILKQYSALPSFNQNTTAETGIQPPGQATGVETSVNGNVPGNGNNEGNGDNPF